MMPDVWITGWFETGVWKAQCVERVTIQCAHPFFPHFFSLAAAHHFTFKFELWRIGNEKVKSNSAVEFLPTLDNATF
jgi:hypothetical protein